MLYFFIFLISFLTFFINFVALGKALFVLKKLFQNLPRETKL